MTRGYTKYPVCGSPTALVVQPTLSSTWAVNLLGVTITPGRVLFLKRVWLSSTGTAAHDIIIRDGPTTLASAATGITITGFPAATNALNTIYTRFMAHVPANSYAEVEIPDPGLKFTNWCIASMAATAAEGINGIGGAGYEV